MGGKKDLVVETDVLVVQPNQPSIGLAVCVFRTTYLVCLLDMLLFFQLLL